MTSPRPIVLVVDDSPDNILLLSALLKDRCDVRVAINGATALRILQATPEIGLVLLDVMMPDMDGLEVCRRIRAEAATAGTPVVFLTARDRPEDAAQALGLGAAGYLVKPVSPAALLATLDAHLPLP